MEDTLNQYPEIDSFVSKLSSESRKKTLKVVRVLFNKANLTGSSTIAIPFQELSKNKILDNEAVDILKNLHVSGMAKTFLTIAEKIGTNERPGIGIVKGINEDERIFNSSAKVHIKKDQLEYLKELLTRNRLNLNKNDSQVLSIPKDKTFKDMVIKFLDNNFFEISIGDKKHRVYGLDLGLLKTKNNKYTEKKCLNFLMLLSMNNGVYPLQNHTDKDREERTSRKRELKNAFQNAFGTTEDPFFGYENKQIRIKIKLIPPRELRKHEYRNGRTFDDVDNPLVRESPFK